MNRKNSSYEIVYNPMAELQKQLHSLFDNFLGETPAKASQLPSLNVTETESSFVVTAEVPGIPQENLEIQLENQTLILKGERKKETEEKEGTWHRIERSFGSFKRAVSLSSEVDANRVEAVYKDGVLQITLPKLEQNNLAKRISITNG